MVDLPSVTGAGISIIRKDSCPVCKFVNKLADGTLLCQRFPPTVESLNVMMQHPATGQPVPHVMGNVTQFPQVKNEYWCGEWKPRVELPGAAN